MKSEQWIGKKGAAYWYYRFRDSEYYSLILIGLTMIVCLVLFFMVILPQLSNWFSIRDEIVATRSRISVLQSNINFINNLNKNELENNVQTATTALPIEKNFSSMLNIIADSAIKTGISLNDYSFQVGNVGTKDGSVNDVRFKDVASVRITLVVQGTVDQVKHFITDIESSVPIAEVVNIDGNDETVAMSIQFYQKSFPKLTINDDKPLETLPAAKLAILQKLAVLNKPAPTVLNNPTASSSASSVPLF